MFSLQLCKKLCSTFSTFMLLFEPNEGHWSVETFLFQQSQRFFGNLEDLWRIWPDL